MTKKVSYLCISDIHLGHGRNPTKDIVANLRLFFDDYSNKSPFAKVQIIFIVGDLFDQLLDCSDDPLYDSLEFIVSLIAFCDRNRIKLRILEGTPSHDRRQNRLFESVQSIRTGNCDLKWVKDLRIEYMQDLDLSVLYIPDEYTSSTETTLGLVKDLFKEQNIEQVDIAMMHGAFQYQMASIPGKHDVHSEVEYMSLVKHFVNVGHIHIFTSYLRILAQGSFDRLSQGEEERKGGLLVTIRDDGSDYFEFIENKGAKLFKTLEVTSPDLEKSIASLRSKLSKIPNGSYIRIKAPKLHPVFLAISELKRNFPFLHFSKLSVEEEQEKTRNTEDAIIHQYNVVEIRPENVIGMIMGELSQMSNLDKQKLHSLLEVSL